MNNLLLDPFVLSQEKPGQFTPKYSWGPASTFKFSPTGDYGAVGLVSGEVIIISTISWRQLFVLYGHSEGVQVLDWSSDSMFLLSIANDYHAIVWNLKTHTPAQKHLIGPSSKGGSIGNGEYVIINANATIYYRPVDNLQLPIDFIPSGTATVSFPQHNIFVIGDSRGFLFFVKYDPETRTVRELHSEKIVAASITSLYVKDSVLSVTSNGKPIKVFNIAVNATGESDIITLNPLVEVTDRVNNFKWLSTVMTVQKEYILAIADERPHQIYMWDLENGNIDHIYECPEELGSIEFHPKKALLLALSLDTGTAYIWTHKVKQTWGALTPDFIELVQNEVYDEREEEFDFVDNIQENIKRYPKGQSIDIYTLDVEAPPALPALVIPGTSTQANREPVPNDNGVANGFNSIP